MKRRKDDTESSVETIVSEIKKEVLDSKTQTKPNKKAPDTTKNQGKNKSSNKSSQEKKAYKTVNTEILSLQGIVVELKSRLSILENGPKKLNNIITNEILSPLDVETKIMQQYNLDNSLKGEERKGVVNTLVKQRQMTNEVAYFFVRYWRDKKMVECYHKILKDGL